MKTKAVLVMFLLLSLCIGVGGSVIRGGTSGGGESDSAISVIAYFCKNDTMKYVRTVSEFSVENGDTVGKSQKLREEFMVIVRDSTPQGYVIEFIPTFFQYGDSASGDMKSRVFSSLKESFKGLTAVFTTDEFGRLQGLENWKEVRDKMNGAIKIMFDSLYAVVPDVDSVMPRANIEALTTLMYSSEEGVLSAYDEVAMLFALHGSMFNIGRYDVDNLSKDSSFTTIAAGYGPYDGYGYDDDYGIMAKSVTKYSVEETRDLVGGVFNLIFKDGVADKFNQAMGDSLDTGMTITLLEDYNLFYNGWPCMMRKQKIIELGPRTKVSTDEIGWVYRSWRQYARDDASVRVSSF